MNAFELRERPQHGVAERIARAAGFALALALAALGSACGNGDAKSDVARPRLENDRIVFPKDSAQLGSFATEPVRESAPQQLRLSGRLVWDENRTVRLFPPFAGRVTHILVKAGDRVKPGRHWRCWPLPTSARRKPMRGARNPISPWPKRISTGCGSCMPPGFPRARK